jgi:hypothetical protein
MRAAFFMVQLTTHSICALHFPAALSKTFFPACSYDDHAVVKNTQKRLSLRRWAAHTRGHLCFIKQTKQ